jgi:hypothetical protein
MDYYRVFEGNITIRTVVFSTRYASSSLKFVKQKYILFLHFTLSYHLWNKIGKFKRKVHISQYASMDVVTSFTSDFVYAPYISLHFLNKHYKLDYTKCKINYCIDKQLLCCLTLYLTNLSKGLFMHALVGFPFRNETS